MTQEPHKESLATRRGVLAGVGLVGLAGAVSACGSAGQGSSPTADALTATSEIPVGGGKIFAARKVVVTQPDAGDFKAFSAVCTHMGCIVSQVADGTIYCPCHGSQYSITDGSVVGGPAPSPLPTVPIKVSGDSIILS